MKKVHIIWYWYYLEPREIWTIYSSIRKARAKTNKMNAVELKLDDEYDEHPFLYRDGRRWFEMKSMNVE